MSDLIDLLKFIAVLFICPGSGFGSGCGPVTAEFVIGRALVVGFALFVVYALWRALTGKKGGGA